MCPETEEKSSDDQTLEGNLAKDMECAGNLVIKKDIPAGFNLRVNGNLTVLGAIYGSEISVGGNLKADGGICFGESKGKLVVRGNIDTNAIEKSVIECGKTLRVKGSILRSAVQGKESVFVGKSIEGGEVSAIYGVTAESIGYEGQSEKGTQIETGMNFRLKVMLEEMNKELADINGKGEKIRQAVAALENKSKTHYSGIGFQEKKLLRTSQESLDILEKQIQGLNNRKGKLEEKLKKISDSFIEVKARILPGTCLCIQHRFVVAQKEYPAGRYTIRNDKICRL